jgi:ABC-type transport system involved in multi-copper enzyme maturation permease subunit
VSALAASWARLVALALNGHRQAVRDKVLYVLAGFGGLLILGSIVVSQLTVGERARIVMDLGLSANALLSALTAVFVSVNQFAREIERRTIDTILAKPVARWELVVGRFLGLGLTLALLVAAMGALHAGVLVAVDAWDPAALAALWLTWIEALLIAAVALFFSSFVGTVPATFATLALIVIGHSSWGLVLLSKSVASPIAQWLLRVAYVALPNLELLNVRGQVVWDVAIPWTYVGQATAYGLLYALALLLLAAAALARRDLA